MDHKNELKEALEAEQRGIWPTIRNFFRKVTDWTQIETASGSAHVTTRQETQEEQRERFRDEARYRFMGRGIY